MLYQRQKQLLALVEALGGRVSKTNLQKLLFLWTAGQSSPAYQFVPYKFGAFSFTSYADLRKLQQRGYLDLASEDWELTTEGRNAVGKAPADLEAARVFLRGAPTERGEALVALSYVRYPFFATRSEIATRLLQDDPVALRHIAAARPTRGPAGIVTIGYEGRSVEAYLLLLLKAGVTILCDVRRNPLSRRYGFSKSTLANACQNVGIRYEHIPQLGIPSSERQDLHTQEDYDALFQRYQQHALPHLGDALLTVARWVEQGERVALTCFERLPSQCHRHCVADALVRDYGNVMIPNHL